MVYGLSVLVQWFRFEGLAIRCEGLKLRVSIPSITA